MVWQITDHKEMPGDQNILQESSTQKYPLGTRLGLEDGRVFHYALAGSSALAAGKLVGSPITAAEREDTITAAVAKGATTATHTAVGTITKNQYRDGLYCVVDGTGQGLQYKIKSNDAIAAGSTGTITLHDPIVTALDTTSDVILLPNPYNAVTLNPDVVRLTLGVPPIPVTASYYFWLQTWGIATVLCGDSTGNAATERWCHPATSTGEFLTTAGGIGGTQIIGYALFDSTDYVDGDYMPIYLVCAP